MRRKPEWVAEMRARIARAFTDQMWSANNGFEMGFLERIDRKLEAYGPDVRLTEKEENLLAILPILPPEGV